MHLPLTNVELDNALGALLIMRADGMSSEDSEVPATGGIILRKRKPVWRSKELQDFLQAVRSHIGHVTQLGYAEQGEPCLSTRPAPSCLPANCYDEQYVQGLSISAREQLNMK